MKRILGALGIALMLITSACQGVIDIPTDADGLIDRIGDLESRVDALEKRCNQINSNVEALQAVVNAMQTGDYITKVEPVVENGVEVGYRITFAQASPIVIYHGKDGADGKDGQDTGATPKIGVRQDTDGNWYWTLNDEWLLDDAGNKVKAVGTDGKDGQNGSDGQNGTDGTNGTDGKDGVTPLFRITDGNWEISYDNGATWTLLGRATGEDGQDGADGASDSIFKSVYESDGYVFFEMTSGAVYKIPVQATVGLDILFSVEQGFGLMAGATTIIEYTVVGGDENTLVRAPLCELIYCKVKPETATSGKLYVLCDSIWEDVEEDEPVDEEYWGDLTERENVNSSLVILVSVTDGKGNSILKSLNFELGVLESISNAYLVDAEAGQVTATVKTNTSYKVTCDAPWLAYIQTKAMRDDQLSFSYTANETGMHRSAIVNLKNDMGQTIESFSIVQRSPLTEGNIQFADASVKQACVSLYDKDGDGELSYDEAVMVSDVTGLFKDITAKVKSFDEFRHFISVTELPEAFAKDCRLLESITLPESLKKIGSYAFANCSALKEIVVPEGVESFNYCEGWFEGCSSLTKATLPSTLTTLPSSCFDDCTSLQSVNIPEGVKLIPGLCFHNCSSLQSIELPSTLVSIFWGAFSGCSSLKSVELPEGFTFDSDNSYSDEGYSAFSGCTSLETVSLPKSLKRLPQNCFTYCSSLKNIVVPDSVEQIGEYCFEGCTSLESITIPEGVTTIPRSCFHGCSSLSEVILPETVFAVRGEAFRGCASLKSFDFSNINYLGDEYERAHFAASGLESVTFPSAVNEIPEEMFSECVNLSEVKLHENITRIKFFAFANTAISGSLIEGTSIEAFEIPASVEYIEKGAFVGCMNLTNVLFYRTTPPEESWGAFEGLRELVFYVPDESLEEYKTREPFDMYTVLPFSMMFTESITECSIANFNAASVEDNIKYRLTGIVTSVENAGEGSFCIKDYSGETYVYNMSGFAEAGIKADDIVVLTGKRGESNGRASMTSASIDTVYPVIPVTPTEFLTKEDSDDVYYKLTGTVTNIANTTYGNCYVTDGVSNVYIYGIYPGVYPNFTPTGTYKNFVTTAGIEVGDELSVIGYKYTYNGTVVELKNGYYLSHEKGATPDPDPEPEPAPDPDIEYSIDLAYTLGANAYDDGVASINGADSVKVLKIGTSKNAGSIDFIVPAGTNNVSFYAVAWNNYPTTLTFSVGGTVIAEQAIYANSGATKVSPFTLDITQHCIATISCSDFTEDTIVTVTTKDGAAKRAIIYSVKAE